VYWCELYRSAVLETEPALIKRKASEAERAVRLRLNELRTIRIAAWRMKKRTRFADDAVRS
jgi:hypothetical protein